jgi:hypothetical protein
LRWLFVINLSGKLRNFGEPKIGGASIVKVMFISVGILRRSGVNDYWPCARLFPPSFERGQRWANGPANSSPVKRPVDWAVPDDCARHAAQMRDTVRAGFHVSFTFGLRGGWHGFNSTVYGTRGTGH